MNSSYDQFKIFLEGLGKNASGNNKEVITHAKSLFEHLHFRGLGGFKVLPKTYQQAVAARVSPNAVVSNGDTAPQEARPVKQVGRPVADEVPENHPALTGASGKSHNFDPIKFDEISKNKTVHDLWENSHGNGLRKVVDTVNNTIGKQLLNPESLDPRDTLMFRPNTPALLISHSDNHYGKIVVTVDTKRDEYNEKKINMNPKAKVFVYFAASSPVVKLNSTIPLDTLKVSGDLAQLLAKFA